MNTKAIIILGIWVGLCFIPLIGPALSSTWGMFWFVASLISGEEE